MNKSVILVLLLIVFCACEKQDIYSPVPVQTMQDTLKTQDTDDEQEAQPTSTTQTTTFPNYVTSIEVLERAYQMATMEWVPVRPIPKRGGGFYEGGTSLKGAPYSSVKEINTYLFQDVSYHTFITAVHNPNSVLYTEDISKEPYHGLNCAPYYGSVCSSTVMWALGISIPYYANQIKELPYMHKLEQQELDSLRVCDVLWKSGHVQMVYEVEHRSDTLYKVKMFEQSGKSAHISTYSKNSFRNLWEKGGYVAYRYEYLKYSDGPITHSDFPSVRYNEDLCPSKGDKAVYRTNDTICVNIFTRDYDEIVLKKDDVIFSAEYFNGDIHKYYGLEPGIYYVYLQSGASQTEMISFEVIDTNVGISVDDTNHLKIYFASAAIANYVALCDIHGVSQYYPISKKDRRFGYIVVPRLNKSEYYCKVVFQGVYGSIINKPIRVQ